jgi:hypothetical protein
MNMELQDLLAEKSFEDLSIKEKNFVLSEMTEAEYEMQRMILGKSSEIMAKEAAVLTPLPPATSVLLALKEKQVAKAAPASSKISAFFNYKVSAWQAVAASLFLFFMVQTIMKGYTGNEKSETALLAVNDTVFVEKYITQIREVEKRADTIVKVVYNTIYKEKEVSDTDKNAIENKPESTTPALASSPYPDVLQYSNKAYSQPASKDTFLQLLSSNIQY